MDKQQIKLVQDSFERIRNQRDEVAAIFYHNLFKLDPSLRPMFPSDMAVQRAKLMATLAFVVEGLDQLERLVPAVEALGVRHAQYGVEDRHYATVGATLLQTLRQGLGPALSSEAEAAWARAYGILADVMMNAAGRELAAA